MHTAWLNAAEQRRLNGFYARCVRRILHIPPSFYSRETNKSVFGRAGVQPLSYQLLGWQLNYFAKLAREPTGNVLRNSVFEQNGYALRQHACSRKQGRPRTAWATAVYKHAVAAAGGEQQFVQFLQNDAGSRKSWQTAVRRYCAELANN